MAIPDGKPATDFSAMNREWVRAVAKEASEGGSTGLPPVTADDNGKILGVVNGAWGAMDAGGGGSSDFSAAEVTLVLTPPEGVTLTSWGIINPRFMTGEISWDAADSLIEETNKIMLPMGKNAYGVVCGYFEDFMGIDAEYTEYYAAATPVLSGGITYDSDNSLYVVTGDCSITVTVATAGG